MIWHVCSVGKIIAYRTLDLQIYAGLSKMLEPDPLKDERKYLKNYGHIFSEECVEEHEKLRMLTLAFCVDA